MWIGWPASNQYGYIAIHTVCRSNLYRSKSNKEIQFIKVVSNGRGGCLESNERSNCLSAVTLRPKWCRNSNCPPPSNSRARVRMQFSQNHYSARSRCSGRSPREKCFRSRAPTGPRPSSAANGAAAWPEWCPCCPHRPPWRRQSPRRADFPPLSAGASRPRNRQSSFCRSFCAGSASALWWWAIGPASAWSPLAHRAWLSDRNGRTNKSIHGTLKNKEQQKKTRNSTVIVGSLSHEMALIGRRAHGIIIWWIHSAIEVKHSGRTGLGCIAVPALFHLPSMSCSLKYRA